MNESRSSTGRTSATGSQHSDTSATPTPRRLLVADLSTPRYYLDQLIGMLEATRSLKAATTVAQHSQERGNDLPSGDEFVCVWDDDEPR